MTRQPSLVRRFFRLVVSLLEPPMSITSLMPSVCPRATHGSNATSSVRQIRRSLSISAFIQVDKLVILCSRRLADHTRHPHRHDLRRGSFIYFFSSLFHGLWQAPLVSYFLFPSNIIISEKEYKKNSLPSDSEFLFPAGNRCPVYQRFSGIPFIIILT